MIKKQMVIEITNGMEARPVALLVQVASQYESNIHIEFEDKTLNAKSIMGMMSIGFTTGDEITVIVDGDDEEEAFADIEKYLTNQD